MLLVLGTVGCFAHHASTPLDIDPVEQPEGYRAQLVVGVREPVVKLDPPLFEGHVQEAWTTLGTLSRSISLIRSMRASGLYREVDFEGQLACPADLLIDVHRNPRLASCDADAPFLLLTLGVIPVFYTCDHGHYFSRVDGDPMRFEFPWHETQLMLGWIVPPMNLLPGWTWKPPPRDKLNDTFRSFLISNASDLLPTRAEGAPECTVD